ncbi:MAG: NifU family protein [Ignavibacteria bacterium]|nr:NifU family protein [Ignavibacteria bacterium]MBP7092465.1 NifU family protein [Candidatus Kapabacteria bacterium]MBK6417712.1 NifU family protein [Ignavibacteria bacterium]MBK6760743.1 NifU family protein [Ignavibacteria bacterium]MBK7031740.1 NifU family protein [Ignavibacteria bacterium]
MTETMRLRIEAALVDVRPFLIVDNGDVEIVRYEESTGVLELRFLGACKTCSMSAMTLRAGIERAIRLNIPEVRRVEAIS